MKRKILIQGKMQFTHNGRTERLTTYVPLAVRGQQDDVFTGLSGAKKAVTLELFLFPQRLCVHAHTPPPSSETIPLLHHGWEVSEAGQI